MKFIGREKSEGQFEDRSKERKEGRDDAMERGRAKRERQERTSWRSRCWSPICTFLETFSPAESENEKKNGGSVVEKREKPRVEVERPSSSLSLPFHRPPSNPR